MQYREFGRFGYKVSQLGFGAMRLPTLDKEAPRWGPRGDVDVEEAVRVIRRALDLGVNFIDSMLTYHQGRSEEVVGKAIKGRPRDKLFIQTKCPMYREPSDDDTYWSRLELALSRLDSGYIDFYLSHHYMWENYKKTGKAFRKMCQKAQDQGLIKHTGLSCHDTQENMKKFIDTGEFDCITLQYNLLDRKNEEVMAYAREKGMGVVVMGPVGGGRLAGPSSEIQELLPGETKSSAEIALRFVFANPNVSVALSGMNTTQQVEENCATASQAQPLSQEEYRQVQEALAEKEKLAELYCTGCGYCMPCEQGVAIPTIFGLMNAYRLYGLKEYARGRYRRLGPHSRRGHMAADACIECGQCEEKCPQNIPIIEQLKQAHKALFDAKSRKRK